MPTTAEAGLPSLQVENWTGILVPATMPDAAVEKLAAEVLKIMTSADIEERARTQGFRIDARGPQAFAGFVKGEIERWAKIIAAAKITPD